MPNIVFILDGDSTRRLIKRKIGKHPTPTEIESFCISIKRPDESISACYYYDCVPFGETRKLPVTGRDIDFSSEYVYAVAQSFQSDLARNPFFKFKRGQLSFDGWNIKEKVIAEIMASPRILRDRDFSPLLSQKQVDMKIGLDIAKIALARSADRILLITTDSDFVPIVDYARSKGIEVVLVLDTFSKIKECFRSKCTTRRYV